MAWDPCVSCGREFHGSSTFTYVTWWVANVKAAYRLRQCEACAADLRTAVMGNGDSRNDRGDWEQSPLQPERKAPPDEPRRLPPAASDKRLRKMATRAVREQNGHAS
jgi:hypothetical protein